MTLRNWPASVIRKTPVTPSGPYNDSSASGVWTIDEAAYWESINQWPSQSNLNPAKFIENLFSTYLYTGNGSTQTITNGIDLSGNGGLVWIRNRTTGGINHHLENTVSGPNYFLSTDTSQYQSYNASLNFAFNSNGFSQNNSFSVTNASSNNYVSWTFRKQPKFFDIVTYTGNGSARTIAHNLGSTPGCIMVKCLSYSYNWAVYHRSNGEQFYLVLNSANQATVDSGNQWWNGTNPTSTVFSVGNASETNANGQTYVAYLFAHDAGGFGLTGTDNVISCGSFTTDGSANATINLGYEPQWVLIKRNSGTGNWILINNMTGWFSLYDYPYLLANSTAAESTYNYGPPTSTGFVFKNDYASSDYIYIAIRRGPMQTPTSGTSVFTPIAYSANNTAQRLISTGGITDSVWARSRGQTSATNPYVSYLVGDRLRGSYFWGTASAGAEVNVSGQAYPSNAWSNMDGFRVSNNSTANLNYTGTQIAYAFKRAPNFFDVVCWWGASSSSQQVSHNLNATPELIITKPRDTLKASSCWALSNVGQTLLSLSSTNAGSGGYTSQHTSTYFKPYYVAAYSLGDNNYTGEYVSYLFGSCPGVSKVGSYTGTGALQTVNCGFTGGARFVLIKRIDSTGDWYAYDSARGISSSDDPYLLLNTRDTEVTLTNYVDTDSTGFKVTAAAPAGLNANGGTYIFLAIA